MFDRKFSTTRRTFMGTVGASLGALSLRGHAAEGDASVHFTHGVASGDPLANSVILWTRVLPGDGLAKNLPLKWQVAKDEAFSDIISEGETSALVARDHIAKVDAGGLETGERYFYRFISDDGTISPIGRTCTLPREGVASVRFGVVSCSNYPQGYFNVYKALAERDVDAVLHLGDYIYEYPEGVYSNTEAVEKGRVVKPKHELIALEDYRERYGLYRSDPDLQAVHAAHPFICVWDDHEIANNSWKDGAENHNEGEGEYAVRKAAAIRAYHEWLPIRDRVKGGAGPIYRSFNYGSIASLIMLDTRIEGRDKQLSYETDLPYRTLPFDMRDEANPIALLSAEAVAEVPTDAIQHFPVPFDLRGEKPVPMTDLAEINKLDPKALPPGFSYLPDGDKFKKDILGARSRTILGKMQEDWLAAELKRSKSQNIPWQVLGQQLLVGKVTMPMLQDGDLDFSKPTYISKERFKAAQMLAQMALPFNLDFWDGYPACRDRVFDDIKDNAKNVIFLAGDTHNAWAFNLKDKRGDAVAIELGTPSVSSPGLETYIPAEPQVVEAALRKSSPELAYLDSTHRGWLELTLNREEAVANWFYVSTVLEKEFEVTSGPTMRTKVGSHTVA